MITPEQWVASMREETRIIKHLATKVDPAQLDWRPTEGQRSIGELLKYMTVMTVIPAIHTDTQNWDHAQGYSARTEDVTLENFAERMDAQADEVAEIAGRVSAGHALEGEASLPWGSKCAVGEAWINMVLKTLPAYRMQLFLYLKSAGRPELNSANLWVGMDPQKPA